MKTKIFIIAARIVLPLAAAALSVYLLWRYEFFVSPMDIDNIIGAIPIALVILFTASVTALVWMRPSVRFLPITVFLIMIMVASIALFPNSLRGNWWLGGTGNSEAEAQPDLTVYEPFSENSKVAVTDEAASIRLSGDVPILDGATALYPVYAAFVQATYDRSAYSRDVVRCTKTSQAYRSIIDGSCDIIFVLEPSESQKAAAKAAGADLVLTPIGREAFVFLVGDENPVNDISVRQIRNIYSGKTARWSTLGWEDGGNIIAFQRPDGSGSQTGLQKIMGDLPIIVPQPLPDESLIGTNSLTQQITVRWNGVQPALGYSYKFYATTMYSNPNAKLLSVNGIAPTDENIRNGTYPFVFTFYAVTNGRPEGAEKEFIDWILSDQGSELIQKTGYTPINA